MVVWQTQLVRVWLFSSPPLGGGFSRQHLCLKYAKDTKGMANLNPKKKFEKGNKIGRKPYAPVMHGDGGDRSDRSAEPAAAQVSAMAALHHTQN
jgi:hypothetical protein